MLKGRNVCLLIAAFTLCFTSLAQASNWTRFRGPNGDGIAEDKDIPAQWDMKKNVLWKVPLPGIGNSSPVIWNDLLFVQTSSKNGSERLLLCIDVKDGATKWQTRVPATAGKSHPKSSLASSSPAVDRDRVYVVFWDGSKLLMKAYTHGGEPVWTKDFGKFTSQHGPGASPVVFEDKVFFANDQDGKSVLMCLDSKTGNEVWHADRPAYRACYSAPIIRDLPDGKKEVVVVSTMGITGYEPHKGTKNWNYEWKFTSKMPLRTTASPLLAHGMLFACSGDGGGDRHMIALTLGETPKLAWQNRKDFPYVPTPLVWGAYLYFVNDTGHAYCYEAKTGNRVWYERLEGDFTASPVLIDGKIFAANESGDFYVFEASPKGFHLLAKNSLEELTRATPAVADNRLFIHTSQHLYCIGKAK